MATATFSPELPVLPPQPPLTSAFQLNEETLPCQDFLRLAAGGGQSPHLLWVQMVWVMAEQHLCWSQ